MERKIKREIERVQKRIVFCESFFVDFICMRMSSIHIISILSALSLSLFNPIVGISLLNHEETSIDSICVGMCINGFSIIISIIVTVIIVMSCRALFYALPLSKRNHRKQNNDAKHSLN